MNIEINHYGVCVDSDWIYVALSWQIIATAVLVVIGWKVYKTFYKK
jgi:hypothetical protein